MTELGQPLTFGEWGDLLFPVFCKSQEKVANKQGSLIAAEPKNDGKGMGESIKNNKDLPGRETCKAIQQKALKKHGQVLATIRICELSLGGRASGRFSTSVSS